MKHTCKEKGLGLKVSGFVVIAETLQFEINKPDMTIFKVNWKNREMLRIVYAALNHQEHAVSQYQSNVSTRDTALTISKETLKKSESIVPGVRLLG